MEPVQTLNDFALTLLDDADAMSAFESDPTGVLQAAGLGDITAQDIRDVLPLVADYASEVDLGQTLGQDLGVDSGLDSDVLGDVANSGDVVDTVGNAAGSVDLSHLDTGIGAVGDVTGAVGDVTGAAQTGDLDLHSTVENTLGDVTDNLSGNLTDNPVTTALQDVGVGDVTGNLSDIHGAVGDVGLNGDVTSVVGDLDLGGIDLGGIGNGNDVDF